MKIVDNPVDKKIIQSIIETLHLYSDLDNKIGLVIIMVEEIPQECYDMIEQSRDKITNNLILIEKPLGLVQTS